MCLTIYSNIEILLLLLTSITRKEYIFICDKTYKSVFEKYYIKLYKLYKNNYMHE